MTFNTDAITSFSNALQALKTQAHSPSFRDLEKRTGFASTTLNDAVRGRTVPTYDTARALVEACGGLWVDWQPVWKAARDQADQHKEARRTATVVARRGTTTNRSEPHHGHNPCLLQTLLRIDDATLHQQVQHLINSLHPGPPPQHLCQPITLARSGQHVP